MATRSFMPLSQETGCSCLVFLVIAAPLTSCRMTLLACCIHESHPTAGGSLALVSYSPFKSGGGASADANLRSVTKNSSVPHLQFIPRQKPFLLMNKPAAV